VDLGLHDKVCVVTGATHGVGLEVAQRLCAEGARVLFVGADAEALAQASEECGGDYLAADVTAPEIDERIVATCAEQMGGLDVLVNCADADVARALAELDDADWRGLWDHHVHAPLRLMRAAAPRMAQGGGGRIVNVCVTAEQPEGAGAAAAVAEAAQLSLSRAFADSYATDNVVVNAVAPAAAATQVAPAKRFSRAREIVDVIVFLCSDVASTVTGAAWSAAAARP
jgi:3-oxoacyl-[acyl-carrier protein] reductase